MEGNRGAGKQATWSPNAPTVNQHFTSLHNPCNDLRDSARSPTPGIQGSAPSIPTQKFPTLTTQHVRILLGQAAWSGGEALTNRRSCCTNVDVNAWDTSTISDNNQIESKNPSIQSKPSAASRSASCLRHRTRQKIAKASHWASSCQRPTSSSLPPSASTSARPNPWWATLIASV